MSDDIIRGEFEVFTEPQRTVFDKKNPIAVAYAAMLDELRTFAVPHIHVNPDPEEFEDVADFGLRIAQCVDRFWKAVGDEAQSNATCNLDMQCFTGAFVGALEGFSIFELDREAAALREDEAGARVASRYGRTAKTLIGMIRGERGI
jgi:hypothetical protein